MQSTWQETSAKMKSIRFSSTRFWWNVWKKNKIDGKDLLVFWDTEPFNIWKRDTSRWPNQSKSAQRRNLLRTMTQAPHHRITFDGLMTLLSWTMTKKFSGIQSKYSIRRSLKWKDIDNKNTKSKHGRKRTQVLKHGTILIRSSSIRILS